MLEINNELVELSKKVEEEIKEEIKKVDSDCMYNSMKVLKAFHNHHISDLHFGSTTGYGYGDIGRDTIENVFAEVLGAEDALVRSQKKYHERESIDCINKLLTLIAEIGHKIATIEPSEFSEQLCATLHDQRVKASHMLADAIDNQIYIIAEIGQKLRTEYKNYLK